MSAEEPGSITRLLQGLKEGRPDAVAAIWDRYFQRVLAVARRRLRGGPQQAVEDGEDVALSAFCGLAAGAAEGRFDRLEDRSDLWQILAAITLRKAINRRRWYRRRKRAGRPVSGGQASGHTGSPAGDDLLAGAVSKEPIPELAAMMREQLERLLDVLDDPLLRRIAEWRMEGATNAEIAGKLGKAVRTVERKLELIRLIWEKVVDDTG